jgi:hypothetical protein
MTSVKITPAYHEKQKGKGSLLTGGALGSMMNDQRSSLSVAMVLRLTARLALVAAYS